MSYFLVEASLQEGKEYKVQGEEAQHLTARRVKKGERIYLQDKNKRRFEVEVRDVGRREVTVHTLQEVAVPPEPKLQITLFQSFIAEQALDYILQKSTELGVTSIVLFYSEHSPHQLGEKLERKLLRWHTILNEAAKQCDRKEAPQLEFIVSHEKLLEKMQTMDVLLFLDPQGQTDLAEIKIDKSGAVGIIVGPEGGLNKDEVSIFSALPNVHAVGLGPRLLRAETASTAAVAIVQNLWGDLK